MSHTLLYVNRNVFSCAYVCVCVCARARAYVYVCQTERERERKRDGEIETTYSLKQRHYIYKQIYTPSERLPSR